MNILVLEDDPNAMSVIEYLENHGYNVWHAQSLLDVAYFLKEDPGIDSFHKLMFDAAVPSEKLSFMGKNEIEYGTEGNFSGLEFVIENYDVLSKKKIAIITAYSKAIDQKTYRDEKNKKILDKLVVIDKSSDDFMAQLLAFLNKE